MTDTTRILTPGSCYELLSATPGSIWAYSGDNGRGWHLFEIADGEDAKTTRRVRMADVGGEIACPDLSSLVAGTASPSLPETVSSVAGIDAAAEKATIKAECALEKARAKAARDADKLAKKVERQLAKEEKALARAMEKDAREEEDGDDDHYTTAMSRTVARYVHRYVPARNASGTATKTCGDLEAVAWLQMDVETFCVYAAGLLGLSPAMYNHLNPGQRRMCYGNRLRAAIKKGTVPMEQAMAAIPG